MSLQRVVVLGAAALGLMCILASACGRSSNPIDAGSGGLGPGPDGGSVADAGPGGARAWFRRDAGIRILPLGDSITQGAVAEKGGYRWPLLRLLTDAGYVTEYVGTIRDGSPQDMPQPWHEGHGGFQIESIDGGQQLEGTVVDVALRTTEPDLVLLLAGTNNLNFPDTLDPAKTTGMYRRLLTQIFSTRPGIGVIASAVPWKIDVPGDQVAAFNAGIHAVVDDFADAGRRIVFVPGMTDAVDAGPENLTDGLHPSEPAYGRMAEQWFRALESVSAP